MTNQFWREFQQWFELNQWPWLVTTWVNYIYSTKERVHSKATLQTTEPLQRANGTDSKLTWMFLSLSAPDEQTALLITNTTLGPWTLSPSLLAEANSSRGDVKSMKIKQHERRESTKFKKNLKSTVFTSKKHKIKLQPLFSYQIAKEPFRNKNTQWR